MPDTTVEIRRLIAAASAGAMDEFVVLTRVPVLRFRLTDVEPPSPLLLTVDDSIVIQIWNSVVGQTVNVGTRWLRPSGDVGYSTSAFIPTSDRTLNTFTINLGDAFLISLTAVPSVSPTQRGRTFVNCGIQRGVGASVITLHNLFSDYIETALGLAWPGAVQMPRVQASGWLRSITGTLPAAGTEMSETMPTNTRRRLQNLRVIFTTSAVIVTRRVSFVFDDGVTTFGVFVPINTQAQSTALGYTISPGLTAQSSAGFTEQLVPAPSSRFDLSSGWRIRTATTGLDPGDQYGAPFYTVEEWIEP